MNREMRRCVIIPAYNAENQIAGVVRSVLSLAIPLIVVDDGSTDRTGERIAEFAGQVEVVSYGRNRGKGYALRQGFRRAVALGYTHAATMDADGQHLADDLSVLWEKVEKDPAALVIGSRDFHHHNMPQGNRFANKFSNFWFAVQTGKSLPDTQTGFRIYPLREIQGMRPFTNRYEAELELLVRCRWRGVRIIPQTIRVHYPPKEERVSHFRGGKDFLRISLLNSILCIFAIIYGYPSLCIRRCISGRKKK